MGISDNAKLMRELCEITSSKRIYVSDYKSDGVPFYRSKEIIERQCGCVTVSTELFISEDKYNEVRAKFGMPEEGDVLLTSVGTLGVPYVVKDNEKFYFKDGNLTWFRKFNGLDSRYLYYWFLSPTGKAELRKCTIGSSQPAFTIVLLKNIKIELPPILKQKKIVEVLSAYDDLIENNNRRIKILEKMAQTIYDEWFVRFRFPAHGKVKMVDSELGKIPEGWEVRCFEETFITKYGKNLPTVRISLKGKYPVYGAGGIIGYYDECITEDKVALITCRGNGSGDVSRTREPAFITNNSFIIRPVDKYSHWKYFFIEAMLKTLNIMGIRGGAAQPQITIEGISLLRTTIPTKATVIEFCELVEPTAEEIDLLYRKNFILKQTRDLLLPKLISGEIDVEDMDIDIGDVDDR